MKCIMACIPREVGVARRVVCEETARSTRLWGAGPLFFFTLSLSLSLLGVERDTCRYTSHYTLSAFFSPFLRPFFAPLFLPSFLS